MKACFVEQQEFHRIGYVFSGGRKEQLQLLMDFLPDVVMRGNLETFREELKTVEVIVSTWHMEAFTKEEIKEFFPNLKLVLYAAGSVKYFAKPFLELGIVVSSAAKVMAVPVAQLTLSLIIQCAKGFFISERLYREIGFERSHEFITHTYPGLYDGTCIGLIGMGAIGQAVVGLLKSFDVIIYTYDPFLPAEAAKKLGVKKTSLAQLFSDCDVISNHLPNNNETKGMLEYSLFSKMKDTAAFINTGRGAQVVETDLVRALKEQPSRYAVLDVTDEEPYPLDGLLRTCKNITILPHIAGFANSEVHAFADFVITELKRYLNHQPLSNSITMDKLATMA